ncbi:MAG: hypothetical protein J5367_05610 [Lachnospiraceae bacterium]|nr:hypothetical protein [Lachnospiraceae bacterium]
MKIGSDNDNSRSGELANLIRENSENEKTKFSDLSGKKKAQYILDYYKWWIIGGIIAVIAGCIFIRDYRENSKPTYLYAEMLNTYLGYDTPASERLYNEFVQEAGVDLSKEHLTIGVETMLSKDNFDTTMMAYQQRLVANYSAGELDVVIGPRDIIEGPANCGAYAEFDRVIPKDLMDELLDREYELYYFDPAADEIEDYEGEDLTPYCAGIYLDNCAYLNNIGEQGAYPVAESEGERVIFTIAANSKRMDHAVQFLRFLTLNR